MLDTLHSIEFINTEDKSGQHSLGGEYYVVTCGNGYGASIIRNRMSYGGDDGFYEIAVLHNGTLCYATPITNDVIGWLHPYEIKDIVEKIKALPERRYCNHSMAGGLN